MSGLKGVSGGGTKPRSAPTAAATRCQRSSVKAALIHHHTTQQHTDTLIYFFSVVLFCVSAGSFRRSALSDVPLFCVSVLSPVSPEKDDFFSIWYEFHIRVRLRFFRCFIFLLIFSLFVF